MVLCCPHCHRRHLHRGRNRCGVSFHVCEHCGRPFSIADAVDEIGKIPAVIEQVAKRVQEEIDG